MLQIIDKKSIRHQIFAIIIAITDAWPPSQKLKIMIYFSVKGTFPLKTLQTAINEKKTIILLKNKKLSKYIQSLWS